MSVIYEKKGNIAIVTIDRPEARNSMDFDTMGQLANAWLDFRDDPELLDLLKSHPRTAAEVWLDQLAPPRIDQASDLA